MADQHTDSSVDLDTTIDQNSYMSTSLEQAVYLERIKMLFSGISTITSATFIGMSTLMYVNWFIVPHNIMYAWFGYMCIVLIYRAALSHLFHKNIDHENAKPKTWAKFYLLGTILSATGWGIAGSLLLSEQSLIQQMFTTILLAGLTAGALSTLSAVYSVYVAFLLITMTPLLITLYSFGDDMHIATAVLVTLFVFFILGGARRMVQTINKSITLRFLHDAALKDIAEKKQQADDLNINLRQQIHEREIVERHLENSMSQLKATLESATDGILVVNNNDQITNYNRSFLELFNISDELIELKDYGQIQEHIRELLISPATGSLIPVNESLLLELKDGRLIESYWNPQQVGDNVIGGVFGYRDATARIRSEASLQRAKNEAELANNQKSEFLSRISHELRTPLNAILGFSHLLHEDNNQHLDAEEKNYASHICTAGEHLLSLIDDLLDISRIESGKLNITLTAIACETIVKESLALVQQAADEKQINLELETDTDTLPPVLTDQTRCKQALVNLMSNAIKYNHKSGHVSLKLYTKDNHVRFEVRDTGPGIEAEMYEEIFQPFTRLKQTEKIQGTGIGLTITKRLIDVMNGTLGVESTLGEGSLFWFELPIASNFHKTAPKISFETNTEKVTRMEKMHTILYVEDEPLNQALVRSIIKQIPNTELITALTGEEGVEIALEQQPDLILMDLNLPGMSGYDALEIIKNEKSFTETPVFAVSANAMPDEIERGKAAGFFDYLIKPINIDNTRILLSNTLCMLENKVK